MSSTSLPPRLDDRLNRGETLLFDLNQFGYRAHYRLTGSDRVRYLNGQVSNNIQTLQTAPGSDALAACIMNAKGKMNAYCWIYATEDALLIAADSGTEHGPHGHGEDESNNDSEAFREALGMRLERYIISDDAELESITQPLHHLIGSESTLQAIVTALSESGEPTTTLWRRSHRYHRPGIDLIGPLPASFPQPVHAVTTEEEQLFRVLQGVPRWNAELDENTLPAEAGLDRTAIDFHKGCYIGQEIISRIKSVGRVNRNLHGFTAAGPLTPGMKLTRNDQPVGIITSTARDPHSHESNQTLALGYLKRGTPPDHLLAIPADPAPPSPAGEEPSPLAIPVELRPLPPIS